MAPDNYRYYCLDVTGKLHAAEWFHAETDEEAIAYLETVHPDALCEIWRDNRLVAKLSPRRLSA